MVIKRFTGKTEEEAMKSAKTELGESIVLMNVRSIRRKGIFRIIGKPYIEVTVALEEESERSIPGYVSQRQEQDIKETLSQVAKVARKVDENVKPSAHFDSATPAMTVEELRKSVEASAKTYEQEIKAETPAPPKPARKEEKVEKTEKAEKTEKPEKQQESAQDPEMIRFMKLLYSMMLDNEVNEKYANQIIEEMEQNTKPGAPFDQALAGVYQKMILKFGKAEPVTPAKENAKVVFFIGPTGVGKTTTIAKVASRFCVEEHKKVALLTADTYRIAAVDQLKTYANILEVPFRIIYSVDEMESAWRDFKQFDYILVDTAGHSHQNMEQKEAMNGFVHSLDSVAETEVHLVLSATTKYRDLLSIADAYAGMTRFKLVFTKLDETTTLGNLLNLKLYTGESLSYVTCGQNVPDDIEVFDAQKTVKQLLGGKIRG